MDTIGQWERWEPIKNLNDKYYIESITDTLNGLNIILFEMDDRKKKIQLLFKNGVFSYRVTDEGLRMNLIGLLDNQYGGNFYGYWTFFKVIDSPYLQWLSQESCETSDAISLKHFCLVAADSIMDIIHSKEPEVILLENDKD